MDFGQILESWEKKNRKYPDKDRENIPPGTAAALNTGMLRKMKPQAVVDLHGYTSREAEDMLWNFLEESRRKGLVKVQIIHGKGLHSSEGGVLIKVVDKVLRNCPFAGMTGTPDNRNGGSGSRWVILK